jgi:septum formation protein
MLVLASASPRRAELLQAAGIQFTVRSKEVDESAREGESPEDYVMRLANAKAAAIIPVSEDTVLGADTTVVIDGEILGKPVDAADARRMLRALSGRRHEVITGICLRRNARIITGLATTSVWFCVFSETDIDEYVASGEPMDKAGAYGIQGMASKFIDRIDGSYANVVGLPVALVFQKLRELDADTI